MTEDYQFTCATCETDYEGDAASKGTACRLCNRIHCSDCVDEFGRCVECAEEATDK